jgi:hypothetical protein
MDRLAIARVVLTAALAGTASLAQNTDQRESEPAHKVALPSDVRPKFLLAYYAVLDVDELSGSEEFLLEKLDAQRASREALVVAATGEQKKLLTDIAVLLLQKQTCRRTDNATDFKICTAIESKLDDRVRTELGLAAAEPVSP